jgi:hypothetical protein
MKGKKCIVFDSGTLISFAMNGLLNEFSKLKEIFNGKFLITAEVKKEIVDVPIGIKKFELQSLRLKDLLDKKILEFPESVGIDSKDVSLLSKELLLKANKVFFTNKENIQIVSLGEISCLALSELLSRKGLKNVISVDERTIRLLCENPEQLRQLIEDKIHSRVEILEKNLVPFKDFSFICSVELIVVAYRKNLFSLKKNLLLLDSLLWAFKSTGCAISSKEIEEIKAIAKREGF